MYNMKMEILFFINYKMKKKSNEKLSKTCALPAQTMSDIGRKWRPMRASTFFFLYVMIFLINKMSYCIHLGVYGNRSKRIVCLLRTGILKLNVVLSKRLKVCKCTHVLPCPVPRNRSECANIVISHQSGQSSEPDSLALQLG